MENGGLSIIISYFIMKRESFLFAPSKSEPPWRKYMKKETGKIIF